MGLGVLIVVTDAFTETEEEALKAPVTEATVD